MQLDKRAARPVRWSMVDLAQLPAADLAAQLARPTGEIGIAVGDYMNRINSRLINAACELLTPPPDGRVLEIGFGNGKLIGDVLGMAPGLTYAGVDISDTMVREATENNRALVQQDRVKLRRAAVDRLPFPNAAFDRALAINTIYFWPVQLSGLAEIRRVLRDDGFLVLASMTPETSAQSPTARPEHGFRVLDRNSLELLHRHAGFKRVVCDLYEEEAKRLDGTIFHRVYHMVLAHSE
jgi:SAM-dependent methyltransferase